MAEDDTKNKQQTELGIAQLTDELKKVVRRVDTLQKSVDLLYQDRTILEDMQASITSLKEVLLTSRQHQDLMTKDLKFDVKEVGDKVEAKIDEVKENVRTNVGTMVESIEKKKTIVVKESWFNRLKNVLKR